MLKLKQLRSLQQQKLRKIVNYAYHNVPLFKKRFDEAKVKPESIKTLDDVKKIPFTIKNDLRDNYPLGILAVPQSRLYSLHASSGTTGKPIVMAYTRGDLERWGRLTGRALDVAGVRKGDVVQNMYGYGLFTGGLGLHYGARAVGANIIPTSTGNTKRQLMLLKDLRSSVVTCVPSYMVYLCEASRAEGYEPKRDFALRIGVFGAEPWSEEARKRIEDTFGLCAHDIYGMSELYGPGVGIECEEKNGLHVWGDEFLVETINPDTGDVLEPGKEGELVFTMLSREAMPLLRYRTRDLSRVFEEECSCGRCHPRIQRIKGRSDDMLIVGGVNVFPSQVEHVLMNIPSLGDQYQIIVSHKELDRLAVKVETSSDKLNDRTLLKQIQDDLQAVLGINADVELVEFGTLPRSEVGKARRVIDLRPKQ
ncbi:MAG TPA: phenylacetate--CoA ligase [Candidatus Acidoferrales bacterium]|nr:phenylacetate--CoA ligase [Candidatus Acidoferrales bacterium]